jgi:hypothetical protein
MMKIGYAALLALLFAVPAHADAQNTARKAFNNCMVEVHNKAIDAKDSVSSFNKAAQEACPTERVAYHDIVAKSERGFGSSAKDADQYANEEVQSIVDSVTSAYSQNSEISAKLVAEK